MSKEVVIEVSMVLVLEDASTATPPPLWDWDAIMEVIGSEFTLVDAGFRVINPTEKEIN